MNKSLDRLSSPKNQMLSLRSSTGDCRLLNLRQETITLPSPPNKRGDLQKLEKVIVSNDASERSMLSEGSDEIVEEGFKNSVWKERSLNIIVLVARFVTYLLTNSDKFKLRYLEQRQFNVIEDQASNFDFYIEQNLIRSRRKQSFFQDWRKIILKTGHCIFHLGIKPIKPDNEWKLLWDVFVFFILLINIVYIPLKISFTIEDVPPGADVFLDTLPQYVFIAEILLNFNVAYYSKGVLVLNQNAIVQHYLKGKFILDFIVLIPFMIGRSNVPYVEFVLLFRVSRVMSIFENLVESLNLRLNFAAIIDIVTLLSLFLFSSHLIACIWHFIANIESQYHESTWIDKLDMSDMDWQSRYLTSFYWACITTLTIGYGDITPVSNVEKLFVIFVALCSSIIFGYTISSIGTIFTQMSENKKMLRDKMTMIDAFVKKRGLNKELQVKVKKFFEYFLKMESDKDAECEKLMQHLSQSLNKEVKIEFYKELLKKSKLFRQHFSEHFLNQLCVKIKEQSFVPEEIIFQEGQMVDRIYFILKGEVEAFISNHKVVKIYGRKTVINEKSFISQKNALFSTKARKFSKVAYFSFEDFQELLEQNPEDKEHFFKVRSLIEFRGRVKFSGCELCNQNHDFTKCPFVFYTPNQAKIHRTAKMNEIQQRLPVERRCKEEFIVYNSLYQLRQVQKTILYYGNACGLYQDFSPNNQFFLTNRNGKTINYSQFQDDPPLSESELSEPSKNIQVSAQDILDLRQERQQHRDSVSQKRERISMSKFQNPPAPPQPGLYQTHKTSQKRPTLILQQIRMHHSFKGQEPTGVIDNHFSPTMTNFGQISVDQVKWVEIEIANKMRDMECNVDLQCDLNYYDVNFNFENVLKGLSQKKNKKKIMLKRKKPKMKRSFSQLQSISIKNLNSFV